MGQRFEQTPGGVGRPMGGRLLRALLVLGLAAGLLPVAAGPAQAAYSATASVDRTMSYRGQTHTFTFSISNTSTAGERIASVRITRPNASWTINGCPAAAPNWDPVPAADHCTYSPNGIGRHILLGETELFSVNASVVGGDASEVGSAWWIVEVDETTAFDPTDGVGTATGPGNSLAADIYGIEISEVVVGQTPAPAIGSACPPSNKKALAGTNRVLIVCGRVHTDTAFTAASGSSSLGGTFVGSAGGGFQSATVSATSESVVLANYTNVGVTSTATAGLTVVAALGGTSKSSPSTTFTGYTTDTTPPPAPSVPDLTAGSDSGVSSADNITNVTTPTFTGTAEPDATVEILVGGVVRATTTAAADGTYTATIPAAAALPNGTASVTARATDPSANVGPVSGALSMVVDAVAPALPTITSNPGAAGNDTSPTWAFSGEANARFTCVLSRPGTTALTDSPCSSPRTYDVSTGNDGSYTFRVSQQDEAGNTSGQASSSYTLDRQDPGDPTITSAPPDLTSNAAVQWTFTGAEGGGSYECVLVRPNLTEVVDSSCASPKAINLSSSADGNYTFKVRQRDAAGNFSAFVTDTFTLDRQAPPAPAFTAQPPTQTNDPLAAWNFTGETGGSFECVLTAPGGAETTDPSCSRPKSYNLGTEADGLYTFKVRQTDNVGNAGPYAASTFTLDRQAPAAPNITVRPANATNDPDPAWTFTGEFGASYECVLVRPNSTLITAIPCTSPTDFNLGSEPDGGYTFRVRQIDAAGNTGPYAVDDFVLDRVAPVPPAITGRPSTFTNDDTPTWEFEGDGSSSFDCIIVRPDNTQVSVQPCSSPHTANLTLGQDGAYTFRVRQTDDAGNRSLYTDDSFTLDRQAPVPPTITAQPPERTNDDTPDWSFSGEFAAVFDCVLVRPNGTEIDASSCSSPRGFDLSGEADGDYTFKVRQTDRAANTGTYATDMFTLDRLAPAAPVITDRPANVTADQDPEWQFTGEVGATFECVLDLPDGSQINRSPCTSPATFVLSGDDDGDYVFNVRQMDAAGNPGEWENDAFTLDRVPPGAPAILSGPDDEVRNPAVGWTFSGEPHATFECVLVRPDASELAYSPCSSPRSIDLSAESDGDYTFKVRQIDEAGHPGAYATDSFTLDRQQPAAPTITARPPEYTNDPGPDWEFSGESGGTYDCLVVRPNGSEIGPVACSSPSTFNLTKEQDGNYTFKVRQTDDAGNVGPYATDDFVLDRDVPRQPSFTSLSPNTTASNSPRWGFTGEADATFECFLVRSDGTERVAAPCASPHIFSMTGEADGNYTFKVRQVDLAGNRSGFATDGFTLDRTAPDALMITSEPPAFASVVTPSWGFEGESGGSYECFLVKPNGVQTFASNCTAPKTYDLSREADGPYTFKVRQIDSAFNRSEFVTSSFTLDRAAPAAPTFTDRPPDATNDPRWSFVGEANAAFECIVVRPNDSHMVAGPCESPAAFDFSGELDGRYTFKVLQIDRAGNAGAQATDSFTLDRQAPPVPTMTVKPPADTKDPDVTWGFTGGEDGGKFDCVLVDPDGVESTTPDCSGPQSHDLTGAPDGTYTFKVRHTDEVGNASGYATSTITLDRVAPEPPAITSTPRHFYDVTPTWEFSGEAGERYDCVLQLPDASTVTQNDCSSPVAFDLSDEADGNYTFKVRQTDAAGNASAYSNDEHLFNGTPPTPVLGGGPPAITDDATHQMTIDGEPDAVFECVLVFPNGTRSAQMGCASPYEIDLTNEADGDYTLAVRQWIGDQASLFATQEFTLDRMAAKPAVSVAPGPTSNSSSPTWSFEGEEGATFECVFVSTDGNEDAQADCSGHVQRSLTGQPDGAYTLKVRQTDRAGNVSAFAARTYELDTTAPSAPTFRATPQRRTRDLTPTWAFDGEGGATYACRLTAPDGVIRSDGNCSDQKTFNLDRVNGRYRLEVTQTDRAGNVGPAVVGVMILDRVKPVAKNLRVFPKRFRPARTTKVPIRFRRSERASATVLIKRGTKTLRTFEKPLGRTRLSFEWRPVHRGKLVAPGRYKVLVKLKDIAGNRSRAAVTLRALP